jgi:ABC-type multidrug transport system permease subunit
MANTGNGKDRIENILAYMIAGLIGSSILAIVAIPVITVFFKNVGAVPWLVVFPWVALPLSALLIISLLVVQIVNKGKSTK